jgi:hypothetical protein
MSDASAFNSAPYRLASVLTINLTGTATTATLPAFVFRECDSIVVDSAGAPCYLTFGTAAAPAPTATPTNSFRFTTNKTTAIGFNPAWTNISAATDVNDSGVVRLMFGSGFWNPIAS